MKTEVTTVVKQLYEDKTSLEYKTIERSVDKNVAKLWESQLTKQKQTLLNQGVYCYCQVNTKHNLKTAKKKFLEQFPIGQPINIEQLLDFEMNILFQMNEQRLKELINLKSNYFSFLTLLHSLSGELKLDKLSLGDVKTEKESAKQKDEGKRINEDSLLEEIDDKISALLFDFPRNPLSVSDLFGELEDFSKELCSREQCLSFSEICNFESILQCVTNSRSLCAILNLFTAETVPLIDSIQYLVSADDPEQALEDLQKTLPAALPKRLNNRDLIESLTKRAKKLKIKTEKKSLTSNIFRNEEIVIKSFDRELMKTMDGGELINEIKTVPYYTDINKYLNWSEIYESENGSLYNFIKNHSNQFSDNFYANKSAVYRFPINIDISLESCERLTAKEFALRLLGVIVAHKGLDFLPGELIRSKITEIVDNKHEIFEDKIKYYVNLLSEIDSELLAAGILQKLILPSFKGMNQAFVYQQIKLHWDPVTQITLSRIGKLLGVTEWIQNQTTKFTAEFNYTQKPSEAVVHDVQSDDGVGIDIGALNDEEIQDDSDEWNNKKLEQLIKEEEDSFLNRSFDEPAASEQIVEVKEVAADGSECTLSPAFQDISEILQDQFGQGLDTSGNPNVTKYIENLNKKVNSAIKRLAEQLYSKDFHFLLELIQNADDNMYPDGLDTPLLKFIIKENEIITCNNEIGFKKENISALCNVGNSTKENKQGYIGHKGIGFKSVFRITDAPEVHSGGFQISFDRTKYGNLGYIKPLWLEDGMIIEDIKHLRKDFSTIIRLPFKKDFPAETVRDNFNQLDSYILLFLHKIKSICLTFPHLNQYKELTRKDSNSNVIQLQEKSNEGAKQSTWLLEKKQIAIPDHLKGQSKNGVDIDQSTTEIILAFPLEKVGDKWILSRSKQTYPLFAYLPLRQSENLNFIIQADFIVPSSRETVDLDAKWNEWLREELPSLFKQAVISIEKRSNKSLLSTINSLLNYIPTRCRTFLQKLPEMICNELYDTDWLLDVEGIKEAPKNLIIADQRISQLISNELLFNHTGKRWIHPQIQFPKNIAPILRINTVTTDLLVQLLQSRANNFSFEYNTTDIQWISDILLIIIERIQDHAERNEIIGKLSNASILPVVLGATEKFTSIKLASRNILLLAPSVSALGLSPITLTIAPAFFANIPAVQQANFIGFLKKMGIHYIETIKDYIKEIIIPFYQDLLISTPELSTCQKPHSISPDAHNIILRFANFLLSPATIDEINKHPAIKAELRRLMMLPCKNESKHAKNKNKKAPTHLVGLVSSCFLHIAKPEICKLIPLPDWYVIHPVTTTHSSQIAFLEEFNILPCPAIEEDKEKEDFASKEWTDIVASADSHLFSLVTLLLSKYDSYYQKYFKSPNSSSVLSSFGKLLIENDWIHCSKHKETFPPSHFFTKETKETVLKHEACFLNVAIPSNVATMLKIRQKVTHVEIIEFLSRHYTETVSGAFHDFPIVTLSKQERESLENMYTELFDICERSGELEQLIKQELASKDKARCIFIQDRDNHLSGRFAMKSIVSLYPCKYSHSEVWGWPSVAKTYQNSNPKILSFFEKVLNVPYSPAPRDSLFSMYRFINPEKTPGLCFELGCVNKVHEAIEYFASKLDDRYARSQLQAFTTFQIFPLFGKHWVSLSALQNGSHYLPDPKLPDSVYQRFGEKGAKIALFPIPQTIPEDMYKAQLRAVTVLEKATPTDPVDSLPLVKYLNELLPVIQRYLIALKRKDAQLGEYIIARCHTLLPTLACKSCTSIQVAYSLAEYPDIEAEVLDAPCRIQGSTMFTVTDYIGIEVLKQLSIFIFGREDEKFMKAMSDLKSAKNKLPKCKESSIWNINTEPYTPKKEVIIPHVAPMPDVIKSTGNTSFLPAKRAREEITGVTFITDKPVSDSPIQPSAIPVATSAPNTQVRENNEPKTEEATNVPPPAPSSNPPPQSSTNDKHQQLPVQEPPSARSVPDNKVNYQAKNTEANHSRSKPASVVQEEARTAPPPPNTDDLQIYPALPKPESIDFVVSSVPVGAPPYGDSPLIPSSGVSPLIPSLPELPDELDIDFQKFIYQKLKACRPSVTPASVNVTPSAMRSLNESGDNVIVGVTLPLSSSTMAGQAGEYLIYQAFKADEDVTSIVWVNEIAEQYKPYDIVLERKGRKEYIEVKSSADAYTKDVPFAISLQELAFALANPNNYIIVRVYGVKTQTASHKVINLVHDLQNKKRALSVVKLNA